MRSGWTAFALGVGVLQCQGELPGGAWLAVLAGLGLGLLAGAWFWHARDGWQRQRVLGCALCIAAACGGFVYAAARAHWRLAEQLPAGLVGQRIDIAGHITGLPTRQAHGTSFLFTIDADQVRREHLPALVQLSWSSWGAGAQPVLTPGARWSLRVRLYRPHAHANPGLRDLEATWFERGIRARGQVVQPQRAQSLGNAPGSAHIWLDRLRARLGARIDQVLGDAPRRGIVTALALGEQGGIDEADREALNRTGTIHLVAVSGLHVGLAGGICGACAAFIWRRLRWRGLPMPLRWPAHKIGALGMLAGAGAYALLAGFNLPAQRAWWMAGVAALSVLHGQRIAPSSTLMLALTAVLLLDPWAMLTPGFWLSFGAVGAILLAMAGAGRHAADEMAFAGEGDRVSRPPVRPGGRWRRLRGRVRALAAAPRLANWSKTVQRRLAHAGQALREAACAQYAVTLVLLPLTAGWFAQVTPIAPLANAFAIPWVSLLSTPSALAGVVLPRPLDAWALRLSLTTIDWLMLALDRLAAWPHAQHWMPVPNLWCIALALGAACWALAPRGWPMRGAMPLAWLPLVLPAALPADAAVPGTVRLSAIDVGQGPAVLVETARHRLLFGAGSGGAGANTVVPYLRANGVRRLDALIGPQSGATRLESLRGVLEAMPVAQIHGPASWEPARDAPCTSARQWTWDDVGFELTGVSSGPSRTRGADICLLRIRAGNRSTLLAGDLDARAERALVEREAGALTADLLLVPREGSRAASTEPFLDAVAPHAAVIQVGFPNRFDHPDPRVLARYRAHGVEPLRTDRDGAVRWLMPAGPPALQAWRTERRRYWAGQ